MWPKLFFPKIIVAFILWEVKVFSQFALSLLKALSLPKQIHFLQLTAVFIIGKIKHRLTINYVLKRLSIYNLWPCRCSANADKYTAYTQIKHNKNILECSRVEYRVNESCTHSWSMRAAIFLFLFYCTLQLHSSFLLEFVSLYTFLLLNQYVCVLCIHC